MAWSVVGTNAFEDWFIGLDESDRARIEDRVDLLEQLGPSLGRPVVDSIQASRHHNMKELRAGSLRVLFIFDPLSTAVLLLGGDKRVSGRRGTSRRSARRTTCMTTTSTKPIRPPATRKPHDDKGHAMTTKSWNDIKQQRPTSSTARVDAHLDNLAEDLGVPLAELRRFVDLTQVELAQRLLVTQPSVSEIERTESPAVPTVRRYVEALGAHLELTAVFDDGRRILLDV